MSSYDSCGTFQNLVMVNKIMPWFILIFIESSRSLHYKFQHSPLIVMKTGMLHSTTILAYWHFSQHMMVSRQIFIYSIERIVFQGYHFRIPHRFEFHICIKLSLSYVDFTNMCNIIVHSCFSSLTYLQRGRLSPRHLRIHHSLGHSHLALCNPDLPPHQIIYFLYIQFI